jgi:DNA-binding transcriptional MerR regulator
LHRWNYDRVVTIANFSRTSPFPTLEESFMLDGFRGPQVCKIVGITYRQLDYWARTNLLRPSLADAKGSGSQRKYSYQDLVELKVIKQLLDAGISLKAARTAVEYLRVHLGEDIGSSRLVLSGENPILVRNDGQLIDLLRHGQGVLNVVPLEGLVQELAAAIVEFRPVADGAVVEHLAAVGE